MPDARSRLEQQRQTLTTVIDRAARQRAIPMSEAIMLPIADIRRDGGTQPRARLDPKLIADYAEDMRAGAEFPPVEVFYDGEIYWLADGYHRIGAALEVGRAQIAAHVHQGTQRDAVLFSVGVNAEHGRRRTNEDKRRAVMKLLSDPEWAKWSDRDISRQCKVSHELVRNLRNDSLADSASEKQPVTYTSKSGRQTVMDTSHIREANIQREQPKPPGRSFDPDTDWSEEQEIDQLLTDALETARTPIPPTRASPGGIIRDTVVSLLREHGALAAAELRELLETRLGKRLDAGLFFGAINGLCATGVIVPRQPGQFALPEGIGDQQSAQDDAYQDVIPPMTEGNTEGMQPEGTPAGDEPVDNYDTPAMQHSIRQAAILKARDTAISLRRIGEHKAAQDFERVASFWAEQWGL